MLKKGRPTRTGHREPAMSLTRTDPHTPSDAGFGSESTGFGAWRVFSDADARRAAIAADLALDLALDLAADLLDGDF